MQIQRPYDLVAQPLSILLCMPAPSCSISMVNIKAKHPASSIQLAQLAWRPVGERKYTSRIWPSTRCLINAMRLSFTLPSVAKPCCYEELEPGKIDELNNL